MITKLVESGEAITKVVLGDLTPGDETPDQSYLAEHQLMVRHGLPRGDQQSADSRWYGTTVMFVVFVEKPEPGDQK